MTSCLKCIVYTSLNAHFYAICKDNLFKFSVIGLSFCIKILLLTFIAIKSLLSDLCPFVFECHHKIIRSRFTAEIIRNVRKIVTNMILEASFQLLRSAVAQW